MGGAIAFGDIEAFACFVPPPLMRMRQATLLLANRSTGFFGERCASQLRAWSIGIGKAIE